MFTGTEPPFILRDSSLPILRNRPRLRLSSLLANLPMSRDPASEKLLPLSRTYKRFLRLFLHLSLLSSVSSRSLCFSVDRQYPTSGPIYTKTSVRNHRGTGLVHVVRFTDTMLNMSAADIKLIHVIRNLVINGDTSELTGTLSATIMQRKLNERKDSMARLIRSPMRGGDENVRMAKNVMTMEGMMTLKRKKPGFLRM